MCDVNVAFQYIYDNGGHRENKGKSEISQGWIGGIHTFILSSFLVRAKVRGVKSDFAHHKIKIKSKKNSDPLYCSVPGK